MELEEGEIVHDTRQQTCIFHGSSGSVVMSSSGCELAEASGDLTNSVD